MIKYRYTSSPRHTHRDTTLQLGRYIADPPGDGVYALLKHEDALNGLEDRIIAELSRRVSIPQRLLHML
jgi:hypothetical protein